MTGDLSAAFSSVPPFWQVGGDAGRAKGVAAQKVLSRHAAARFARRLIIRKQGDLVQPPGGQAGACD